tara:strand:- start:6586 stop:7035 length:450 start_codon:yes stop_codon:yes gene_type:complete
MATIGNAWADGVWTYAAWGVDVWDPDAAEVVLTYQTGDAQSWAITDIAAFMSVGDVQLAELATDLDAWMDYDMGFAESVFLGVTEMAGIFDNDSYGGGDRLGPIVKMKTQDIIDNSIDQGSTLTIRTRTFIVRGVQRDGTGISTVILEE